MPKKPASKPVLAVDIDEVLVPFLDGFLDYYNSTYDKTFRLPDRFDYYGSVQQITGITDPKELFALVAKFLTSDYYQTIDPVPGSVDSIERLRHKYSFVAITAREENMRPATKKLLDRHFKNEFQRVEFVGLDHIESITKIDALRNSGAVALIDDNPKHVAEAAEVGVKPILFGVYPWNQDVDLPASVERANNWEEVERLL